MNEQAQQETYFDDDLQMEVPVDRQARYEMLMSLWRNRRTPDELREIREHYGPYEYGIARAEVYAIHQAIQDMRHDDREALKRWRQSVSRRQAQTKDDDS